MGERMKCWSCGHVFSESEADKVTEAVDNMYDRKPTLETFLACPQCGETGVEWGDWEDATPDENGEWPEGSE